MIIFVHILIFHPYRIYTTLHTFLFEPKMNGGGTNIRQSGIESAGSRGRKVVWWWVPWWWGLGDDSQV